VCSLSCGGITDRSANPTGGFEAYIPPAPPPPKAIGSHSSTPAGPLADRLHPQRVC